jgi:hypothetical protein
LIEDLLEIARLQDGRVELWRTRVDLRDVITRAVRPLEPLGQARQQQRVRVVPIDERDRRVPDVLSPPLDIFAIIRWSIVGVSTEHQSSQRQ